MTTPAQSESEALYAAREDLRHFEPIYERYFPRIYAYCARRVGAAEAEDLTSQIFTNAMLNVSQYRGGLVAAWLFRIAHNTVINHLKHASQYNASLDEQNLASGAPEPLEHVIQAEEEQAIRNLVAKLPPEQQELLLLRVVGGLSAGEIGALVGKNAGAVRVAIHRIMRQLQEHYQKGGASYGTFSLE
jgi:RNA polymerase sigma-70 factor (ECF subfamily)